MHLFPRGRKCGELLILKFEELLLSLFSNSKHRPLTDYFVSLCQDQEHQLARIMEANFAYNLKLEAYAELCNMSLSTKLKPADDLFRRYRQSPGWHSRAGRCKVRG